MPFLILGVVIGGTQAHGATTLTVSPDGVTLAPGHSDRLIVRLQGVSGGATELKVDPPSGVQAASEPLDTAGTGSRAWVVRLVASRSFDADGTAIIKTKVAKRVVSATFPVKVKAAPTAASQLQTEVSFQGETLLDGLPRPLLVRITNLADLSVQVSIEPKLPPFIKPLPGDWQGRHGIPPRSTVMFMVPVNTDGTVDHPLLSGKHQVAVVVSARQGTPAGWSGQTVATTTLNVGVPGMSEVQGLLQVPSFLLFPGFLLVTTFVLVVNAGKPRTTGVELKDILAVPWSSGLWLIAISLSMALIPLYPYVSRALGVGARNILYGFDLSDVIRVWFTSILIGGVVGLATLAFRDWQARKRALATFSESLSPIELLMRLARLGRSADIACVTLNGPGDPRLHHLGEDLPGGKTWATSAIACQIVDATRGFDQRTFSEAIRQADPEAIAEQLTAAVQAGALTVEWQKAGQVRGVAKVDVATFANREPPVSVIKLT